jgi:hypothetical protein
MSLCARELAHLVALSVGLALDRGLLLIDIANLLVAPVEVLRHLTRTPGGSRLLRLLIDRKPIFLNAVVGLLAVWRRSAPTCRCQALFRGIVPEVVAVPMAKSR